MDEGSWPRLLFYIMFVAASAYFSAAESAFVSVNRLRLKSYADDGDKRAQKALFITTNFDRSLTTLLIGNNIVNIGAATIATVFASSVWGEGAVIYATIITTLLIFFIGEMVPKYYAKAHSEEIALAFSSSIRFLMKLLWPIAVVFMSITKLVNRLSKEDEQPTITEDELVTLIETVEDEGVINDDSSELLQSALAFSDNEARHVMTAAEDIVSVDVSSDRETALALIKNVKYSRLPVWEGEPSHIIGVLPARAFLRSYLAGEKPSIRALMTAPMFASEHETVNDLLSHMTRKKAYMAIIRDDDGKTAGIVTVEDIVEELVGEIWDEEDVVSEDFMKLGGNCFSVSGKLLVSDAFSRMGYECDDPELFGLTLQAWVEKKLGITQEILDETPVSDEDGEAESKEPDIDDMAFAYRNIEVYVTDFEEGIIRKVEMCIISDEDISESELIAEAEAESDTDTIPDETDEGRLSK